MLVIGMNNSKPLDIKLAPIVLFTYDRLQHTVQTITALQKNEYASESDLIVYSDAPKNNESKERVENTRRYLNSITGFKSVSVVAREENFGLANSIIDGVTTVVNKYGRIIVLEDDLITSPFFLKYMNESLEIYKNDTQVACIHGYVYPIKKKLPDTFFLKGADCWGWATWRRGWEVFNPDGESLLKELERQKLTKKFDFDGSYPYTKMLRKQIKGVTNSWAIRWYASAFLNNKFTLYPNKSLIYNSGNDGSGTNCVQSNTFEVEMSSIPINVELIKIEESKNAKKEIIHYFRYTSKLIRLKDLLKNLWKKS